jgi:hypothetical protein
MQVWKMNVFFADLKKHSFLNGLRH